MTRKYWIVLSAVAYAAGCTVSSEHGEAEDVAQEEVAKTEQMVLADQRSFVENDYILSKEVMSKGCGYSLSFTGGHITVTRFDNNGTDGTDRWELWGAGPLRTWTFLVMQGDGNFVEYDEAYLPLWATNTDGNFFGAFASIQNDGNLVVYNGNGAPIWASNSNVGPHNNSHPCPVNTVFAHRDVQRKRIGSPLTVPYQFSERGNDYQRWLSCANRCQDRPFCRSFNITHGGSAGTCSLFGTAFTSHRTASANDNSGIICRFRNATDANGVEIAGQEVPENKASDLCDNPGARAL